MVIFENVRKVYDDGTVAVNNLNLEIKEGEFVVLIGPSGCGKTTTLKMVNRLEECTAGKIYVDGNDITTVDPVKLRRGIGYVIQQIALMPHLSVAENIGIVPRLHKWEKNKIDKRVDELLEMAGLNPAQYKYRLPDQLSGGQQQRIGVLRALAVEPRVVLMDEPFGALDPISRDRLQNELLELQKKLKKTIIFVTHDIDEALKLADRIVIMRQGRVEQIDTPSELKNNPVNDFVKAFIGEERLAKISPEAPIDIIIEEPGLKVLPDTKASLVLNHLEDIGPESAQVVDRNGKWLGMAIVPDIKKVAKLGGYIKEAVRLERKLYIEEATLRDAAEMLADRDLPVPILDENNIFLGVVTHNGIARLTISRLQRKIS
ncbi:MAG: osmoprotectant transport system ATP-binding protein [Clostridia bacterium]|jgi:osmoprotectant transport system ATP-binding protein|nr:osmoprotectant transport system ATP-binding protein [Clostridia bacterium]MDN5322719.1 osmoprotectant transport system ATP-binding protein [Clostridia bacterium]